MSHFPEKNYPICKDAQKWDMLTDCSSQIKCIYLCREINMIYDIHEVNKYKFFFSRFTYLSV